MQKTIDEIRKLIDPAGYITDLERVKESLERNRGAMFVNLDLNVNDPEMNADQRRAAVLDSEKAIRQAQWRIEKIEERVEDAKNGAMGGRPARRRRKKADAKEAKK